MYNMFNSKPKMFSTASLNVVENTITKIRQQFYEFSHIESQFFSEDEKTGEVFEFTYEEQE